MPNDECPIWKTNASCLSPVTFDGAIYKSPRAGGKYSISGTAKEILKRQHISNNEKARLTTWLHKQRLSGDSNPKINLKTLTDVKKLRPMPVEVRADRLLRFWSRCHGSLGKVFPFSRNSLNEEAFLSQLSWIESPETVLHYQEREILFFVDYLESQTWIKKDYGGQIKLTVEGYTRLAELDEGYTPSNTAFIAMWFDDSMNEAYEQGIVQAVKDIGYEPVRIDRKEHAGRIDDEIIAEIKRARFVVADFTHGEEGARGGVYYEAGFAQGLGIPVIFTCHKNGINELHFDTRQYNHIDWKTPRELRSRLANRIAAILGDGPIKSYDSTYDQNYDV